jgi:hypothetical protein
VPNDLLVVLSPLTVHEAKVNLRSWLAHEFGEETPVAEQVSPDRVELRAARDWSDSRRAFGLALTLEPRPGGSTVAIATRSSPASLLAEIVIVVCGCSLLIYKTGFGALALVAIGLCALWLPIEYRRTYRTERDRLRAEVIRTVDAP